MAKKRTRVQFFKLEKELAEEQFRVAVFGSARIKPNSKYYKEVVKFGEFLGKEGIDVVTGGGPGIMEAACKGHDIGRKKKKNHHTHAYGLTIRLPKEQKDNKHFDMKKDFDKFSQRLDYFIELSNAVVVATGGVGTLLEFLYTWQLIQVEKIYDMPIILLGDQWPPLIEWIKKGPLSHNLLSKEDLDSIYVARNAEDAFKIIKISYEIYKRALGNKHDNIKAIAKNIKLR